MIDHLLAARLQMAFSLGFHILFAVAGMAMPAFMVLAEWRHQRTGRPEYLELSKRWAKGTAILFAVGAVSGTVLSFELGLLWPKFMERAGPLIGMPFSLEGFAFFLEAIALGVFLYGRKLTSARVHLASGIMVAVCGVLGGIFVIAVNAFMNSPRGITLAPDGTILQADLVKAFFSPAFPTQAAHMLVAAYTSTSFVVLGIHAFGLRKNPKSAFHRSAVHLLLPVAAAGALLQAVTGDLCAKHLAVHQPSKLAAAEALWETQRGAPLLVGGIPLDGGRRSTLGLHVPKVLSVLGKGDPDAEITGLADVPEDERPPVLICHLAFQVMVTSGLTLIGLSLWGLLLRWRKKDIAEQRRFLWALSLASPLGLLAVEAGWVVTEVGRQPWIIRGVLRVRDAVTPMPGLEVSLFATLSLYALLGVVVVTLLRRHVMLADRGVDQGGTAPSKEPS